MDALSKHIGVVYSPSRREIIAVINPDREGDLDDPNLLSPVSCRDNSIIDDLKMLRLPRMSFPARMTPGDCALAVEIATELIG